jgi:hypothetical protein
MHIKRQWANKHLLPPLIDDKRGEPKMTSYLTALVKRVAELRDAYLWVCQCAKQFIHRWICPLGRWEKLAFECPRLADSSREAASGKIFIPSFYYCWSVTLI